MRSPVASTDNRIRGFTLIELMLVIALFAVAAGAVYPLGKTFYDTYVFRNSYTSLHNALDTASLRARTGLRDHAHGVKILNDSYVLFEGATYASRIPDLDSEFSLSQQLQLRGRDEFVFVRGSGAASATGVIALQYYDEHATITVHAPGIVE